MKFYQACYGKPGNNWELLNCSQDTPMMMATFFEKIGSSCTPQNIGAENSVTASGEPLCLYEIISNENIVCVLKAQYGDRDNFGRPKMYAHGFMFEAEDVLKNPNEILSIGDENFKFSMEDTRNIPGELSRIDVESAAISEEGFRKLLACVYYLLESPTDFPFYILCNNNTAEIKGIICGVLQALPYSLRSKLSFSNANSLQYANFKRIMFVDKVPNGEYYYSIEEEKTNLELPEELYQNSLYLNSIMMSRSEYEQYCETIHHTLQNMHCSFDAGYAATYLADMISKGIDFLYSKEDSELVQALLYVLSKMPCQSSFIDNYLAEILRILELRSLYVGENIMQIIEMLCENTESINLVQNYKTIKVKSLIESGQQEIIEFLSDQYVKGQEVFEDWCSYVLKVEGGIAHLLEFYKKKILLCTNFFEVIKLHKETQKYSLSSELILTFKTQCFSVAKKQTRVQVIRESNYEQVLEEFQSIYTALIGEAAIESQGMLEEIKQTFWSNFKFEYFSFEKRCITNCKTMIIDEEQKCELLKGLVSLYDAIGAYGDGTADYADVEDCLKIIDNTLKGTSKHEEIIPIVQEYVLKHLKKEKERHFNFWTVLACLGGKQKNPIYKFVKWKLPVILDVECFGNAFSESARMRESADRILVWMIGSDPKSGFLSKIEDNPELYKTIKKEIKILQEYKKQQIAEEKMKEKERRKLEKMSNRNSQQEQDDDFVVLDVEEVMQKKEVTPKKKGIFSVLDKIKK